MSLLSSLMQGGVIQRCGGFHVSAMLQKEPHHVDLTIVTGYVQRCVTALSGSVNVSTVLCLN